VSRLDLTIDGADEVDPQLQLIKGGGGALLHEKIVASASERLIIIVDSGKLVGQLGRFALPVEVVPAAWRLLAEKLKALGCIPTLRLRAGGSDPFVTDEGNHILDCAFGAIADPEGVACALAGLPGVVEHGLFIAMASVVIVGRGATTEVLTRERTGDQLA
jgi:ribose 5-phosphate isomerase A